MTPYERDTHVFWNCISKLILYHKAMPLCRRLILSVVMCLVAASAALPQGMMPVVSAQGMAFVICTQAGPVTLRLLDSGAVLSEEEPDGDEGEGGGCPWAFQGASLALVPPAAGCLALSPEEKTAFGFGAQDLAARAKLSGYDSRGPPAVL